jgi:hypothetical protein
MYLRRKPAALWHVKPAAAACSAALKPPSARLPSCVPNPACCGVA